MLLLFIFLFWEFFLLSGLWGFYLFLYAGGATVGIESYLSVLHFVLIIFDLNSLLLILIL